MNGLTFTRIARGAFVALGALALSACGINSVPTKEEAAKAQWGNVETALQRRADLIPNLVSVVRGAAASERQILTEVTQARADATRITVGPEQLSDPDAMARLAEAQSRLTVTLQRLQEAYPELQSQPRFADLMVALDEANNLINTERVRYNDAARDYNTEIRTFPATIAANVIYGADPLQYFEADEASRANPDVDLENIGGTPAAAPAATNDNAEDSVPAAAAN
ncbi:LemA family protein [Tsuneonella sp. HG222]